MVNASFVSYNETLDVACCIIAPQEKYAAPFKPTSIPIDTSVPRVGEVVHMVSHDTMEISEIVGPADQSGTGQKFSIMKRVSIRVGVVTALYPNGFRQYKWPCFTTSIPAEPGMSGGLVLLPRDGEIIASCGIVCADIPSENKARSNWNECGESVVASAWSVLCLPVPESIPATPETPTMSIYELMRSGRIDEPIGGLSCIQFIESKDGNCQISRS